MYTTVISGEDSRVKVAGFDTDYMNANYIDVRLFFILALLSLKHNLKTITTFFLNNANYMYIDVWCFVNCLVPHICHVVFCA